MDNGFTKKEVINVFINMGGHPLAMKSPNGKEHRGILYDIWKLMRVKLDEKYTFIEHFETKTNYDQLSKDVENGKYDMVIAHFQLTENRMKRINFTNNLIIGKNTILHLPKVDIKDQLMVVIKKIIGS